MKTKTIPRTKLRDTIRAIELQRLNKEDGVTHTKPALNITQENMPGLTQQIQNIYDATTEQTPTKQEVTTSFQQSQPLLQAIKNYVVQAITIDNETRQKFSQRKNLEEHYWTKTESNQYIQREEKTLRTKPIPNNLHQKVKRELKQEYKPNIPRYKIA